MFFFTFSSFLNSRFNSVWLQGMPADRMIAEIARRVPSGGIGLGIPIMGGGGGETAGTGEEAVGSEQSAEEMVAASDAAVDADRQATVASSGAVESDADSPSALFGDVAASDDSYSSTATSDNLFESSETTFKDDDSTFGDEQMFSDDTSFSPDDNFEQQSQGGLFGEGDSTTTDVFDTGADAVGGAVDEEAGSSILGTLWDIFMGDD